MRPPQPSDLIFTGAISPSAKSTNSEGEMKSHGHSFILDSPQNGTASSSKGAWYVDAGTKGKNDTAYIVRTTQNAGGDLPHNTLQPLFGAYKFRRTN